MSTPIYGRLYDPDFTQAVKNIQVETSIIKKTIFKNSLMKHDTDKKSTSQYLNAVHGFLKYWDDYSKDLMQKIRSSRGMEDVYSIGYQWVKDSIYAKYDYASVLPFVDGIIKMCNERNVSIERINDFKEHTISKAFKDLPLSVGELIDSSLTSELRNGMNIFHRSDKMEAKYFDSIRSNKIFNEIDRKELYKSIDFVIEFLSSNTNIEKHLNINDDSKIFIAAINEIFDYMSYSLIAFLARVYTISVYAYPYIERSGSTHTPEIAVSESVKVKELTAGSQDKKVLPITIFKDLDDAEFRDPENGRKFFEIFEKFITSIGAGSNVLYNEYRPKFTDEHSIGLPHAEKNMFVMKMPTNEIITYFKHRPYLYGDDRNADRIVTEMNQIFRELLFNTNHAIEGTSTPKQEMFHAIKLTDASDNNLDSYKLLANDLYIFAIYVCSSIASIMRMINTFRYAEHNEPRHKSSILSTSAELLKMLSEFYKDTIAIFIAKGRDIENKINELKSSELDKVYTSLKLDVNDTINTNDMMMTSIPDTTRLPIDMIDVYGAPTFESFELYDEYAKYILNAEDDLYFSEAFNISEIINKIVSMVTGAWKRMKAFFDDKTVKRAIEWVKNHEQTLKQMDFSGVEMEILPYKINIEIHPKFNNLSNGIKNFTEKNAESAEAIDAFIKSLYPDDTIYGWFNNDSKEENAGKIAAAKYHNYMLYYDEDKTTENVPQKVMIKDSVIKRNVDEWVKTMLSVQQTVNAYKNMGDQITSGINNMKTKLVSVSNNTTNTSNNADGAPTSINNVTAGSDDKNNTNNSAQQTQNSKPESANNQDNKNQIGNDMNTIVTRTTAVVNNIYVSLNGIFIEYIKAMYSYLQEAHSKGRK